MAPFYAVGTRIGSFCESQLKLGLCVDRDSSNFVWDYVSLSQLCLWFLGTAPTPIGAVQELSHITLGLLGYVPSPDSVSYHFPVGIVCVHHNGDKTCQAQSNTTDGVKQTQRFQTRILNLKLHVTLCQIWYMLMFMPCFPYWKLFYYPSSKSTIILLV